MKRQRHYLVKELAQMSGVSVRALHHYHDIGILVPKARTNAGYRVYDDEDLLRLQQIVVGRELGLALEEIRRSLDDPHFDRKQTLMAQKQQLLQRAQQTSAMIRAVDAALASLDDNPEGEFDMKQLFDGFDPSKYEAEAKDRWGDTDSYKESAKRTKNYTPESWAIIKADQAAIYEAAFALLKAGKAADAVEAMDIAERHRLSIDRWFYPCSVAIHAGLADLYESDARFAENINKFGHDLTPFLSAAIRANAQRFGAAPSPQTAS